MGYDPTQGAPPEEGQADLFEADLSTEAQIPVGTHPAVLTDLFKDVSQSGNDMWVWEFTFQDSKTLRMYTALTAAAAWRLAQVVRALQLPMVENRAKFSVKDALGRWAMLQVEHKTFDGQLRAQISMIKPWPQGQPTPKSEATPF